MSDHDRGDAAAAGRGVLSAKQILNRIARLENADSRSARIVLMRDTLTAIASGSLSDPVMIAAAVAKAVDGDGAFRRSRAIAARARCRLAAHLEKKNADFQAETDFFGAAEKMADNIKIAQPVLNFLHAKSRCNPSSPENWEREVRTSYAMERMAPTFRYQLLEEIIDPGSRDAATDKVVSPTGTLLMAFHGGLVMTAKKILPSICSKSSGDGLILGRRGTLREKGELQSEDDSGKALFLALRGLQEGRVLFIAPDGPDGRQTTTMDILGTQSTVGEGAAFLAYTSKCKTAWYSAGRKGRRLFPVVELGPCPEKQESFHAFKDRLYRFYAGRIEALLTGDPRDISLRGKWIRLLGEAARLR